MFSSIGPPPARTILPTSYSGDAPAGAKETARRVGYRRGARSRRLLRRTSTGHRSWELVQAGLSSDQAAAKLVRLVGGDAPLLVDLLRQVCVCVCVSLWVCACV